MVLPKFHFPAAEQQARTIYQLVHDDLPPRGGKSSVRR